ncbi:hypothetical protein Tco_0398321 [Tanacetum coccineum]
MNDLGTAIDKDIVKEQGLVIAALKNELRKLKGKAIDNEDTVTHSVDQSVLRALYVSEHVKANYPQDSLLESAFRYTKVIQDLLSHISRSCPSINNCGPQLIEVTPRKKDKKVSKDFLLVLADHSFRQYQNDRILKTHSSNSKNKVEAHPRNVKSSLNKRNGTVNVNGSAVVQNLKKQDNSDYVCIHRDDCMSSDNLCVSNSMNDVKFRAKPKKNKSKKDIWKPTGKVFTQIGYIWRSLPVGPSLIVEMRCPFFKLGITLTNEVALLGNNSRPNRPLVFGFRNDQFAKIMVLETYQIRNLTVMASEHSNLGPALHEMTPVTISSGLVPNPPSSTPFHQKALLLFLEAVAPEHEMLFLSTSRAWYDMLSSFLISNDFSKGSVDPTLFIRREGNELILVQIYVDDIIFAASTPELWKAVDPSTIVLTAFADAGIMLVVKDTRRRNSVAISSTEADILLCPVVVLKFLFGMRSKTYRLWLWINKIPIHQSFTSQEHVENGVIELYLSIGISLADIFTKALGRERIEFLINKLGMRSFTPDTLKQLADEVDE